MTLFLSLTLTSQTFMLRSAEQLAKTVGSVGDHCKSSMLDVWLANAPEEVDTPEGVNVLR